MDLVRPAPDDHPEAAVLLLERHLDHLGQLRVVGGARRWQAVLDLQLDPKSLDLFQ